MKRRKIVINAPVTLLFVLACFAVTLAGVLTNGKSTRMFFMTYRSSLKEPLTYVRMFSHVLGHTGWKHFMGNAVYLLLLGPMLEEKHGSGRLLAVIVVAAAVTGIANHILFANVGLCGASGVVFAFILLASFTGFREGEIPLTFLLAAAIYMGQQVYDGLAVRDNISNMGHIIGGLVGSVMGYQLNRGRGTRR